MFVENSEECDAKQHGSRVCVTVSMRTRCKVYKYFPGEMSKVENPSVIYEDNQGAIFLAYNRQVVIRTKHIYICHRFLREMVEEKDIDI